MLAETGRVKPGKDIAIQGLALTTIVHAYYASCSRRSEPGRDTDTGWFRDKDRCATQVVAVPWLCLLYTSPSPRD